MSSFMNLSRRTIGIICILLCAILWAGASVLIQYIYEDLDFNSPFFLTYIATSLLALHLPVWFLRNYSCKLFDEGKNLLKTTEVDGDKTALMKMSIASTTYLQNQIDQPINHIEVIKVALIISPIWFLANCLYNYSLLMTSVSSSTIISNLSASFTLLFSWRLGIEEFSWCKIVGIIICFLGSVSVGLVDSSGSEQEQTFSGDVVALLAAAGYGLYTTIIRVKAENEDAIPMQLLLGYIGLINATMLSLPLLILFLFHTGGVASISGEVVGFITLNGFCDTVIADYLWAKAVILTSPTIATIGMSITIPFAIITDYFIRATVPSTIGALGAFSVIVGFILVNLPDEYVDSFCKGKGEEEDEIHVDS